MIGTHGKLRIGRYVGATATTVDDVEAVEARRGAWSLTGHPEALDVRIGLEAQSLFAQAIRLLRGDRAPHALRTRPPPTTIELVVGIEDPGRNVAQIDGKRAFRGVVESIYPRRWRPIRALDGGQVDANRLLTGHPGRTGVRLGRLLDRRVRLPRA